MKAMAEWNEILLRKEYHPEKPDEIVVAFTSVLAKRRMKRVLDLGCGAGRHVLYLARRGFEAYGADISEAGLKLTKERLESCGLKAEILRCDMKSMPYIPSCFDAVICVQTIYHQKLEGIRETVSEIRRVLKKGGLLLANFHSKRSGMYGEGIEVEEDTFVRENGPEKGILHHFFDENELRKLFESFRVDLKVEEERRGNYLRSLFIVLAEKL